MIDAIGVCGICFEPMVVVDHGQRTHPCCNPERDEVPRKESAVSDHARSRRGSHQCPANTCAVRVSSDKLACPRHWAMVDQHTQRRVYAAWRNQDMDAHRAAIADATDEINAELDRRAARR